MGWKEDRDAEKAYGLLVYRDPSSKTPEFKIEDRPLTTPDETFESDECEAPAAPPKEKLVKVEKQLPSPVVVLARRLVESVSTDYYDIAIYKQIDSTYFAQATFKSDNRVLEAHGTDFNRVRFDIIHLAAQGLQKKDMTDDLPRSNKVPGKLA